MDLQTCLIEYAIITYVMGAPIELLNLQKPNTLSVFIWALSPVSVPLLMFLWLLFDDTITQRVYIDG